MAAAPEERYDGKVAGMDEAMKAKKATEVEKGEAKKTKKAGRVEKGKAMKAMKEKEAAEATKAKAMKAIRGGQRAAQLLVELEEAASADMKGKAMKAARLATVVTHDLMKVWAT